MLSHECHLSDDETLRRLGHPIFPRILLRDDGEGGFLGAEEGGAAYGG